MPIVVNTNSAATTASFNLSKNADALRKSLARLSSGKRITQPAEDAGGLAVAYKLDSHARRTEAVLNNHQNALSYLQVQDGALETVGKVVNRMSELRTMAADITKNSGDIENYSKEFRELQSQLNQMSLEKFNGISLFAFGNAAGASGVQTATSGKELNVSLGATAADKDIYSYQLLTHPSGVSTDGAISLNVVNLEFVTSLGGMGATGNSLVKANGNEVDQITSISIGQFTAIIQNIADARAENGAEQQRVQQSYELHQVNLVNLEAAHGRIMDVDVAMESTRFAKNNVLVQASASMTAQANQLSNIALTLLQ
ncbi:flagellin [Opitutales bacterium]|nr:flagellin [Opitutales bacterium]